MGLQESCWPHEAAMGALVLSTARQPTTLEPPEAILLHVSVDLATSVCTTPGHNRRWQDEDMKDFLGSSEGSEKNLGNLM